MTDKSDRQIYPDFGCQKRYNPGWQQGSKWSHAIHEVSEREQVDLSEAQGHDSKMLFRPLDVDKLSRAQPYGVV